MFVDGLQDLGDRSRVDRLADGFERGFPAELACDQAADNAGESRGRHGGKKRRPFVDHQHRDVGAAFELLVQRGHFELFADQTVVEHRRKIGGIGDGDWHRRIEALVLAVEPFVARHPICAGGLPVKVALQSATVLDGSTLSTPGAEYPCSNRP